MLRSTLLLGKPGLSFVHDVNRDRTLNRCPPDPDRPKNSIERRHALKEKGQYTVTLNIVTAQAERKKDDEKTQYTQKYLAAQRP